MTNLGKTGARAEEGAARLLIALAFTAGALQNQVRGFARRGLLGIHNLLATRCTGG